VKQRDQKPETPPSSAREPAKAEDHNRPAGDDADRDGVLADRRLAERCLAGEVAAWEEFYGQCHEPLLLSIEIMMGLYDPDPNLVEEIAARVWYALIANDGKLLGRYNSKRGARLITFIRTLAKTQVNRHFRAERRRRKRERAALRERPGHRVADVGQSITSLEAFLATLTPHERNFCHEYLLDSPCQSGDQTQPTRLGANVSQLSHRIREKLLRFVGREA